MNKPYPDERPWHREPYVWLLISLPAAAVVAGFYTWFLAATTNDGLVVDDYYRQGLEINRVLRREQNAARAGLQLMVDIDRDRGVVLVTLSANPGFEYPPRLDGLLAHATRQGLDYVLDLQRVGDASYRATVADIPVGQWYLDVGTQDWRLLKHVVTR